MSGCCGCMRTRDTCKVCVFAPQRGLGRGVLVDDSVFARLLGRYQQVQPEQGNVRRGTRTPARADL